MQPSDPLFIALPPAGQRHCLVEHLGERIEDRLLRLLRKILPKVPQLNRIRIPFRQRGGVSCRCRCMGCILAIALIAKSTLLTPAEPSHQ